MSDPHRPDGSATNWQGAESAEPSHVDPAYAGQLPMYGGYPPAEAPDPTRPLPQQYWAPGQPPGGPVGPPAPPRSPRWLLFLAGAAVLLVVGLVIALVVVNGSTEKSTAVSRLPTIPGRTAPPRVPMTTPPRLPPGILPPTITPPTGSPAPGGAAQIIVYRVTGKGRAISIAYMDDDGVFHTEINVELPWTKQVRLTPPASTAASVTVINIGEQVTCSLTVDGAQVRQRTGTFLTICTAGVN